MEWFKHKTGSLDDPDFNAILDEFGSDGYMMFFGLLEIYGKEFSSTDVDGFLNIRLSFVARKLRKSSAKVRKFLNYCGKSISKPRFVYSINGSVLSYKVPKFMELASNWTRRPENQPTEVPTEVPTAIEVEEEVEEESNKAFSLPSKEDINESSILKLNEDLDKITHELYSKGIFPKVYSFKNKMLKQGKNERAIIHALTRCYIKKKFENNDPWAYCIHIINIEDGNYNERDHLKATEGSV